MKSHIALLAIAGNILMAGGDISPIEPVAPAVVVNESWNYYGSLYVFAAGIGGETADGQSFDTSFSNILDNLDMTYMGTIGMEKDKWALQTDLIYLKVGDKPNLPVDQQLVLTNIQLKNWIITPTVSYRIVETDQWNVNVLAGARYLYMDTEITISPLPTLSESDHVWDGIVGLKGDYTINDKWFMPFVFDVGTGDTDITWQAFAGVGYKYENFDVIAGYRHLEWEFDNDVVLNSLDVSGPIIGIKYRF